MRNIVELAQHIVVSSRKNISNTVLIAYRKAADIDDRAVVDGVVHVMASHPIGAVSGCQCHVHAAAATPLRWAGVEVDAEIDGREEGRPHDNM